MTTAGLTVRIWNEAGIPRRDADGYVNATAMCQANGKLFADYRRLAQTQEYIEALASHLGVTAELRSPSLGSMGNPIDLIRTITTGPNDLRGTWIHPRLAVDLARWISPAFAVWMDGWFLESIGGATHTTHRRQQPKLPPRTWSTKERLAILSDPTRRHRAISRIARAAFRRQLRYVEVRDAQQWRPFGRCFVTSREMAALLSYAADMHGLGTMAPSVRHDGPGRLLVDLEACHRFLGGYDDDPRNAAQLLDDVAEALYQPELIQAIPGMLRQVEARLPEWAITA